MITRNIKSKTESKASKGQERSDKNSSRICDSRKNNPDFEFTKYFRESHGKIIYSVQFCNCLSDGEPVIFATCGSNIVSIYECQNDGTVKLLQCFTDPSPTELYYTLAWSFDPINLKPILAAAGHDRVIRIINPTTFSSKKHLIGHGMDINDLKFHPKNPYLLLSASKDTSVRLWNIQTNVSIAIFQGINGHKSDVLSADFDAAGNRVVTCGIDRSVKIWQLNKPAIRDATQASFNGQKGFINVVEHFPEYSIDNIHTRYVDCVKWMGNLVLSKSNENSIVCWLPGPLQENSMVDVSKVASIIHEYKYPGDDYFFIRFSLDVRMTYMAVGNGRGTTYLWKMNGNETANSMHLRHSKCTGTVRATAFSPDAKILITVCDDGSVWKWDRIS